MNAWVLVLIVLMIAACTVSFWIGLGAGHRKADRMWEHEALPWGEVNSSAATPAPASFPAPAVVHRLIASDDTQVLPVTTGADLAATQEFPSISARMAGGHLRIAVSPLALPKTPATGQPMPSVAGPAPAPAVAPSGGRHQYRPGGVGQYIPGKAAVPETTTTASMAPVITMPTRVTKKERRSA